MATPPMLDQRPVRGAPADADPAIAIAVALLSLIVVGLGLGGILAVYDWRTPGAMGPLVATIVGLFAAALLVIVVAAASRWLRGGRPR